jgi:uncharacterized iron-regulated membrane protein
MKDNFRQSMSWLHTWCGLTCGWLLCAIMLTGTLSVFRDPLTRWMEARPLLSVAVTAGAVNTPVSQVALQHAWAYLAQHAATAKSWRIDLPLRRGDALQLHWQPEGGGRGKSSSDDFRAAMHPVSGQLLPQPWGRSTEGGRHFMSFHYMLHGGTAGYWLVGWVAMCMLVALISGVIVHRRIFKDFFAFRSGKGQRSWLDAHNVTAVLALPFLFMIVYTGLTYFYSSYMPWPLRAVYGSDDGAYMRYQGELSQASTALPASRRKPLVAPDLSLLLPRAEALMKSAARMVIVTRPGRVGMTVRVIGNADNLNPVAILNGGGNVLFDGADGAVLYLQESEMHTAFSREKIHRVLQQLHVAGFGGWTIKWLYFLSGLMGTAMVATGTILFSLKRRQKNAHEFGAVSASVYRCIESVNVPAVAGIMLACIAYLYANRLLPASLGGRSNWEIRCFFAVWLATLLHAALRSGRHAWYEQLLASALLCLGLPLLNWLTTGQQLWSYAAHGDWLRAGVELTVLVFGGALMLASCKLRRVWLQMPVAAVRKVKA